MECTSSAIQGLALFKKLHPGHRQKEIEGSINNGIRYIEDTQNPDGSWYDNYLYSSPITVVMHGMLMEGFRMIHLKQMQRCYLSGESRFVALINRYGCWGICYTYGTWFAVEGLAACGRSYRNCSALRRACEFLLSKQLPCGGWGESYISSQNKVLICFIFVRLILRESSFRLTSSNHIGSRMSRCTRTWKVVVRIWSKQPGLCCPSLMQGR